jgi:hypothetical protein
MTTLLEASTDLATACPAQHCQPKALPIARRRVVVTRHFHDADSHMREHMHGAQRLVEYVLIILLQSTD